MAPPLETPRPSHPVSPYAVQSLALTRRFDRLVVVDALDLSITHAAIFGLLGSNGAGKTTTLRMLITLLPPTSGSALVAGYDIVTRPRAVRSHIGYVPQMVSADGELTGYENLLISAKLYGVPPGEREGRIAEALAFMELTRFSGTLVAHFSGGMIRGLELAQAMLHRPQVPFLDEPTIGLDPVARRAVWEWIRELRDRYGTTIVMTTCAHAVGHAERFRARRRSRSADNRSRSVQLYRESPVLVHRYLRGAARVDRDVY